MLDFIGKINIKNNVAEISVTNKIQDVNFPEIIDYFNFRILMLQNMEILNFQNVSKGE